jgi:hypothetical protein
MRASIRIYRHVSPIRNMNSDAHRTAEFDRLVQRTMNDWKVPGLAIAVVQGDKMYTNVNHLIDPIITSLGLFQPGL